MMSRLYALAHRWFSDSEVQIGTVEMDIVLRQAALIFVPLLVLGIGIMAVLP
ncbi:hypothetical protein SAMN02927924_01354 [Sphingobium faniae]|nr:hypothetical protein SAMN02927924_01354 [Sphingobium faniae]